MTAKLDLFAAAPTLMKNWTGTSTASIRAWTRASSGSWRSAPPRSTAAPIASMEQPAVAVGGISISSYSPISRPLMSEPNAPPQRPHRIGLW